MLIQVIQRTHTQKKRENTIGINFQTNILMFIKCFKSHEADHRTSYRKLSQTDETNVDTSYPKNSYTEKKREYNWYKFSNKHPDVHKVFQITRSRSPNKLS